MGRAPCCEKVGLKKGRWTAEEDDLLANYIHTNGEGSWRSLPKNAGLLRCGKSCRLRWINYLRADLKRGNISKEEEEMIIKLHSSLGNRWSLIAGHLPGRTDNEIKNYWNSHLSRRIHSFRKLDGGGEVVTMVLDKIPGRKRRGGRTSRSAMKKNKPAIAAGHEHRCNDSGDDDGGSSSLSSCLPQDEDGSNMNLDQLSSVVTIDGTGLMSPSQVIESTDELLDVSEESVVSSSDQEREGGALVMNEGGAMGEKEGVVGLEGNLEGSLWDVEGGDHEMWPWFWESSEDNYSGVMLDGSVDQQVESLASWLLSDF